MSKFLQLLGGLVLFVLISAAVMVAENGSAQKRVDDNTKAVGQEPAGTSAEKAGWKQAAELLKRGDRRAIPVLEELFQREGKKLQKQQVAMLLVTLGEPDEKYFDFLAGYAREAVEINVPYPRKIDRDGKPVKEEYSQEFLEWCKNNKVEPQEAARKAVFSYPMDVMLLGRTGDPRGFDILIQGLDSPNYLIVAKAALGLALIGDKRAIGPIREAATRTPKEATQLIARALVYFDDSEAQAAARQLITDESLLEALRQSAVKEKERRRKDKAMFHEGR